MAGYPISELKKAPESKGRDLFPIQQDGVTRQVELGILSNASKITASTSSGVITKEGSYVLQNNSAVINFTLNNAVGRAVSNNDYVDSASAAAGWIVKVINLSTRSHTVIAGSNSWTIAAGDVHEYYWTGSAWTFHNVVTESRLNNALANYDKAELWTDSLINIANDTTLKSGKEITFTVNDTTISDLPVANRGIVITRKNSLNNRCIQEYHCNESTNNSIYYRYLEWNGTRWVVAIAWRKLISETDLSTKNGTVNFIAATDNKYEYWAKQVGNVVNIQISCKLTNPLTTTATTIANISGVSLPATNVRTSAVIGVNGWDTTESCYCIIGSSGDIQCTVTSATTKRCLNISLSYIV